MSKNNVELYIVVTRIFIGKKLVRYKLLSLNGKTSYLEISDFDKLSDKIVNVKKVGTQFVGVGINLTDIPSMSKLKTGTVKKSGKTEEYVKECAMPIIQKRLEENKPIKKKLTNKKIEGENYLSLVLFYSSYRLEMSEHSSSVMDLVDETLVTGKLSFAFSEITSPSLRDGIRSLLNLYKEIKPLNVVDVYNIRRNNDKYFNELVTEFNNGNELALQHLSQKYKVTIEELKGKVYGFWKYS